MTKLIKEREISRAWLEERQDKILSPGQKPKGRFNWLIQVFAFFIIVLIEAGFFIVFITLQKEENYILAFFVLFFFLFILLFVVLGSLCTTIFDVVFADEDGIYVGDTKRDTRFPFRWDKNHCKLYLFFPWQALESIIVESRSDESSDGGGNYIIFMLKEGWLISSPNREKLSQHYFRAFGGVIDYERNDYHYSVGTNLGELKWFLEECKKYME